MQLVLEEFPTPVPLSVKGRTVSHLTDHPEAVVVKFLCGYIPEHQLIIPHNPDDKPCQKCASAQHGESRARRLTR